MTSLNASATNPSAPPESVSSPPADDGPGRETLAAYWLSKLEGAPTVLDFPADGPRPTVLERIERGPAFAIEQSLLGRLHAVLPAGAENPSALLAAVWQALLFRCTDQEDFLLGVVTEAAAGDPHAAVLRCRIDDRSSFASIVSRTAEDLAAARSHATTDWPALLTLLEVTPSTGRHALFQTAVIADSGHAGHLAAARQAGHAPCELALVWREEAGGLSLEIEYTADIFQRDRILRLAGHFQNLLAGLADAPEDEIGALPLVGSEELAQIARFNDTAVPHSAELSLAEAFARQAAATPDAVAVVFGAGQLTYAELDRRANQLAHFLQARGVGPDTTVAISLDRSIAMIVAVLGVLKAGGAYVPVDPAYPPSRRAYMIADSQARLVLTDSSLAGTLPDTTAAVVCLDRERESLSQQPTGAPAAEVTGHHLVYVIYTSGSTGQPKGVALPQIAITNLVAWQQRSPHFRPGARTLQFSSLSFDVSCQELFSTWCSGGTLVLVADSVRRDAPQLLHYLIEHRIERLFLPFVALRSLAEASVSENRIPISLREVYTAGEQLQVDDVVRRFFTALPGCILENQYGPSESHVVTACTLPGSPAQWPALPSIGTPIANATIQILDRRRRPRPIGVPGELAIGGLCLARGYLGKPELTAERFIRDPASPDPAARLYRTGDLARWMPDGTIQFLGRIDHQVKFRGFRIEPGEIAAVLASHADVAQCVAAVRDTDAGKRLVAYVTPRHPGRLPLDALHRFAQEKLPDYMVPSHYVVVEAMPLTPSGKVDVKALPTPSFNRGILREPFVAPRNDLESAMARLWSRLLGVPEIGINDDFFELGGDSLIAVELFARIRREFGGDLTLSALARSPTIAGLVAALRPESEGAEQHPGEHAARPHPRWRSLVPIQTQGQRPPLFCVHGGSGNIASFPKLARQLPDDQPFYALQWDGLDGLRGRTSLPAMAALYRSEIQSVQPHGPYFLAGQCVGGLIAREIARQLLARGETVAAVFLFDSPNLSSPTFRPARHTRTLPRILHSTGARKNKLLAYYGRFFGLRAPPEFRELVGGLTMVRAVWKYRVPVVPVRTILFASGLDRAEPMGLAGHWTDAAMGWTAFDTSHVDIHHVNTEHNSVPYDPQTAAVIRRMLDELRPAGPATAPEPGGESTPAAPSGRG